MLPTRFPLLEVAAHEAGFVGVGQRQLSPFPSCSPVDVAPSGPQVFGNLGRSGPRATWGPLPPLLGVLPGHVEVP